METTHHIYLGSQDNELMFQEIEEKMNQDTRFSRFQIRLAEFVNDYVNLHHLPVPGNKWVTFKKDEKVCIF